MNDCVRSGRIIIKCSTTLGGLRPSGHIGLILSLSIIGTTSRSGFIISVTPSFCWYQNSHPDRIKIKCSIDYPTVEASSAFMLCSSIERSSRFHSRERCTSCGNLSIVEEDREPRCAGPWDTPLASIASLLGQQPTRPSEVEGTR